MQSRWQQARFSKLLSRALTMSGVSQAQIADRAGVSHSQLSRWKAGTHRPDYDSIEAVGNVLAELVPAERDLTARLLSLAGYGAHFGAFRDALSSADDNAGRSAGAGGAV